MIEAIQARHQAGLPLNTAWRQDQRLFHAAYRLFGTWPDAVLAAGFQPYLRKWTKQGVLDAILARHRQGQPMLAVNREDGRLYSAAVRHFGSWHRALLAAGLPAKPRQRRTKEWVIATIQSRHQKGLPLVRFAREVRAVSYAARQHFGSWRAAVLAAGIPDGWQHKWNRQRVIEALQAYGQPGRPLFSSQVSGAVRGAAYTHFGSWYDALAAAGLVPLEPRPAPRKKWTKQLVLTEIRTRSQEEMPLTVGKNPRLAGAAIRHFGKWSNALAAAGVKPKGTKIWSKQCVLEELRARHAQGELSESAATEDRQLFEATKRRFGSWHRALVAAGIRATGKKCPPWVQWTAERIVETIQDRYVRGLPMQGQSDRRLSAAANRRFGGWHAALVAAGVAAPRKPRPWRRWTPQKVIQEIRRWKESGMKMSKICQVDTGLSAAARKHFAGWYNALAAAGIVPTETDR